MPVTENPPLTSPFAGETPTAIRATRFDPPHEIPRADADVAARQNASSTSGESLPELPLDNSTTPVAAFGAETITPALVRQFRTQAQQLASHLETRQRELDHRESELHTQLARHEAAARSARLWFQEQHRKLTQRQSEWERRECKNASQHHSINGAETGTEENLPDIDSEIDFRLRKAEFHELSAQLEARHHYSKSLTKKLEVKQEDIEAAEARLARNEAELQFASQEFQAEREAYTLRIERQQRQWAEERSRLEYEISHRRAELDDRTRQLDKRAAVVEQMRGELLQIQCETLESQLATEELRAELAGSTAPAAVLQSLARLRAGLAEQYRIQSDGLERQRLQLSDLVAKAAEQQQQLGNRQRDFETWMISQRRQIEEQAAQLANREEQLERQQIERENRWLQCQAERRQLEAEVHRLQTQAFRLEEHSTEII